MNYIEFPFMSTKECDKEVLGSTLDEFSQHYTSGVNVYTIFCMSAAIIQRGNKTQMKSMPVKMLL